MFFLTFVTRGDNIITNSASHRLIMTPIIYKLFEYLKTLWWAIRSTNMKNFVLCYFHHVNNIRHDDIVIFLIGIEVILCHQ